MRVLLANSNKTTETVKLDGSSWTVLKMLNHSMIELARKGSCNFNTFTILFYSHLHP